MPLRFADATPEAYAFPLTIGHLLDAVMLNAPDQEIVYRDTVRMTYRTLRGRIGRLAAALTTLGAGPGTTVAVMDWDSHRYLESYFAIPMMGAVLQTVNVRLPPAQVAYTLRHADARVVLCHRDFLPLLEPLLPDLPALRTVILLEDAPGQAPPGIAGEYEALLGRANPDFAFEDFDEHALATTFYTTGTTGDPKGVCFSHRQIVLHALACNGPFGSTRAPGFGADDVYMPLTPMFHVHAWGLPYVATLMGVKQVYPGRYEPAMICGLKAREGVTYSHCVPTIVQMILAEADRTDADLSGWTMTIGGSALTPALWAEARARGLTLHAGYGLSETAPTLCYARPLLPGTMPEAEMAHAVTRAGNPIPLVSIRIVDGEGRDLPHDGVAQGELVVRAPWLTPCYTGDPDASAALWQGGWLHTQDVATIDATGRVDIRDRLKDVVKTGGEWVSSLELEALIAAVPGVAEVAVIGVPDPRWGERPLAVIVPAAGAPPTLEAVNAPIVERIAAGTLSRYARLDRFATQDALPRTSVGKIDKKALRAVLG